MKKVSVFLVVVLTVSLFAGFSARAVSVNEIFDYRFEVEKNPTADGLWMYEWYREADDTFHPMDWNGSGPYFEAPYEEAAASDPHWYCRVRSSGGNMHPGAGADAVKTFVCPEDGEVEFQIMATRQSAVTSGNGNSFRLFLNDTKVWPTQGEYEEVSDAAAHEVKAALQVKKGDKIRFMVGSLGNSSSDGVNVSGHRVTYLSGSNLTPEEKTYRIAVVGDSIVEGHKLDGGNKGPDCWPSQLQEYLNKTGRGKYAVENYGKTGATLQKEGDKPYTQQAEYTQSLKTQADVVIVALGANDAKASNWNAARYENQYYSLIVKYMTLPQKPTVYLAYTTYVADQSQTGIQRSVIQGEMLKIQKNLAEELGLKIIDLNTLTKKNSTQYNDGVHPNAALAKKMGEYVFNAFCSEEILALQSSDATSSVSMIDPNASLSTDTDGGASSSVAVPDTDSASDTPSEPTEPASDTVGAASSQVPSPEKEGNLLWVWISAGVIFIAGAGVAGFLLRKKK